MQHGKTKIDPGLKQGKAFGQKARCRSHENAACTVVNDFGEQSPLPYYTGCVSLGSPQVPKNT